MTYEVTGHPIIIGKDVIEPREVRRLEWTGTRAWYEEVIQADSYMSTIGEANRSGSWCRFEGQSVTKYNSVVDRISTRETSAELVPLGPIHPLFYQHITHAYQQQYGTAPETILYEGPKVCYRDDCSMRTPAIRLDTGDSSFIFTKEGIPLEEANNFRVLSLYIDSPKPAID